MSEIVHCPKCQAAVSVAPSQAGQRVQCPSCLKPFLAPKSLAGTASASAEDEDWLSLADPATPPVATRPSAESQSAKSQSAKSRAAESKPEDSQAGQPESAEAESESTESEPVKSGPGGFFLTDPTEESPFLDEADFFEQPNHDSATPADSPTEDLFADLPPLEEPVPSSGKTTAETDSDRTDGVAAGFNASAAFADELLGAAAEQFADPQDETRRADSARQPSARSLAPDEEFRVNCPICGTVMYAKAKQSGKTVRCPDCHSDIRVPKPPKKKPQPQASEDAETFRLSEASERRVEEDPTRKSATQLLEEASRDPRENEFTPAYDVPSMTGWLRSVFGIFIDPGVLTHLAGLTLLIGVPAAATALYPVLMIGAFPLGLLGAVITIACGFAIMFAVANGHESVDEWPTADPASWFDSLAPAIAAMAICTGPPFALAKAFGAPNALLIGLVLFCIYALFPIILLSMLDAQTITTPFSSAVSKSITKCQEDWGAFYFSGGLFFGALFAYFLFIEMTPKTIAIGAFLSIVVAFIYFAMLGRLAMAISNIVDLGTLEEDTEDEED
jgi:DNA-directed RNA polymerase subunit M/transcription elongation factor TFIIS